MTAHEYYPARIYCGPTSVSASLAAALARLEAAIIDGDNDDRGLVRGRDRCLRGDCFAGELVTDEGNKA